MNKSFLTLSISSLFLFSMTTTQAEIYKWVDAKGVTHYSAQPPVKKKIRAKAKNIEDQIRSAAGKYRPPKASQKTSNQENSSSGHSDKNKNIDAENSLSPPDKKLVEYCNNQRKNLESLRKNFRTVWVGTDGKKTPLTQKQRQQKVELISKNLKETCAEVN